MKWRMHIHQGLLNLLSSKLRSSLALLGILVGTASVVAMVLGGELATHEALAQFKTLGTDLLAVSLSDTYNSSGQTSEHDEAKKMLSLAEANQVLVTDPAILQVAPYVQSYAQIQFGGESSSATLLGVTQYFALIAHINMERGRFISDLDHYAFYCVIGHGLYEQLKKTTLANPIGQQIQIGKTIFTIIGVMAPWVANNFIYADLNNTVILPILTASVLNKNAEINNIILQLTEKANVDAVQNHVQDYLQKILPNKQLYFRSAKALIASMTKQSEILTVFLGLIGSISLLVGGIGVMNIMLVSVVERRREIGIRLALGATRANIRFLFLVEAIILSMLGGTLGVLLGILIAYVIALFWHWQFILFLLPPLIGFSVSTITGVFFGFYPAHQAAKLDPIVALRSE